MKLISLTGFAFVAAFSATSAMAHVDTGEAGSAHWLEHVASSPAEPSAAQQAAFGYASTATSKAQPTREIVVGAGDRYINVERLETVTLRFGDKHVDWTFDTLGTQAFDLSKIFPAAKGVTVYVAESQLYDGA